MAQGNHNRANLIWIIQDGQVCWAEIHAAILMDIRTEIKVSNQFLEGISRKLNALECRKFLKIPTTLNRIANNTAKRRKPKKV